MGGLSPVLSPVLFEENVECRSCIKEYLSHAVCGIAFGAKEYKVIGIECFSCWAGWGGRGARLTRAGRAI